MLELLPVFAILFLCLGVTVTYGFSVSGAGLSVQPPAVVRTGSGALGLEETLPAAQVGTLSTRTDDDTGTITMSDGSHTITTAAIVDIYWDGGVRYGVTVGTVSGTSVPFGAASGEGSGDNLPVATTEVTIVPQTDVNMLIDGDNVGLIAIVLETNDTSLRTAGHIQFQDAADAEVAELDLVANTPQVWDITGGANNPFTGNPITQLKLSQGGSSSSETYRLKIVGVQDASP